MVETNQTKTFDRNELWKVLIVLNDRGASAGHLYKLLPMIERRDIDSIEQYIKSVDCGDSKEEKLWKKKFNQFFVQWKEALKDNNVEFQVIFNFWKSLFSECHYHDEWYFDMNKVADASGIICDLFGEDVQYSCLKYLYEKANIYSNISKKGDGYTRVLKAIANNKNATHKDFKSLLGRLGAFKNDTEDIDFSNMSNSDIRELQQVRGNLKQELLPISEGYAYKIRMELDNLLKQNPLVKAGGFDFWLKSVEDLLADGEYAARHLLVENKIDEKASREANMVVFCQNSKGKQLSDWLDKVKNNLNGVSINRINVPNVKAHKISDLEQRLAKMEKTISLNKSTIETQKGIIAQQQNLISDYGKNAEAYDASRVKGKVYGHNSDDVQYQQAKDDADKLKQRAEEITKMVKQLERQ